MLHARGGPEGFGGGPLCPGWVVPGDWGYTDAVAVDVHLLGGWAFGALGIPSFLFFFFLF
jgi:hypothetical protein